MAGLFALSVDPARYKGPFVEDLFRGTFYQQNRGEKYAGLVVFNNGQMNGDSRRGLFRPTFWGSRGEFCGQAGIGYCGLTPEPLKVMSKFGHWALCFSGNVLNLAELSVELQSDGEVFATNDDIEVIAKFIARGRDFVDGIKIAAKKIKGAFSLLVITSNGIYVAVCPSGRWPLIIGEKEGAVAVAAESGGFKNLGFKIIRDLQPGEIIHINSGKWEQKGIITDGRRQICSFLWVYTARPEAQIAGIPASLVRKRLGAALARRDIVRGFIPHYVISVPDSGRSHAIGYHQEFCRAAMRGRIKRLPFFDELLLRFPYSGRSFTRSTQVKRDEEADLKIVPSGESVDDLLEGFEGLADLWGGNLSELIVAVCEDSIVRGTQLQQKLIPRLKSIGVGQIYVRASNPPLMAYCPWGKTTQQSELLAERFPDMAGRVKHLGVNGLEYNTVADLIQAIGLPREQLCVDCSLPKKE
jgi:amidophosphoribosyltransferase